ncbi:helix-turn-helix transcriptional regulator [Microbacteriaceae bacterium VKM Ac-2854]|nr:helix-turn-helix transcriptional regulator [Microbacteriaceae bacterium VKM Ac-2854]
MLPQDERARQVATTLLEHPATPFGLEEWARTVHTSGKTLQRCFRRDTGMTSPQWRTSARLSVAVRRFDRGEAVAAVARSVGFATTSAFITAFRRRYGVTPGTYRARVSG